MTQKSFIEQAEALVEAKRQLEMLQRKVKEDLGQFVADWDSNDPNRLPVNRESQIRPVRDVLAWVEKSTEGSVSP